MERHLDLVLAIAAGVLVAVLLACVVIRRRRARARAATPRTTQFGLSAVDPTVAENFRAAWERSSSLLTQPPAPPIADSPAPAPRTSRTSIGYAVPVRASGLAEDAPEHEATAFDANLSSYIERHYRETQRLARGSYPPGVVTARPRLPERTALRTSGLASETRPTVNLHASRPPIDSASGVLRSPAKPGLDDE